jgi:branched-chain amino acid transport system substrate-binding protein
MKRGQSAFVLLSAATLLVMATGASHANHERSLPPSFCSKLTAGTSRPDYIVVSDLPLEESSASVSRMVAAIKYVLAEHGYKAGRYSVGYQSCDESTPQTPQGDLAKCASNAKAYAASRNVIGVIGAWSSDCSRIEIPILGSSSTGPLFLLSPINTSPGLTHRSGGSQPGEPGRYYTTGRRNYARLMASDDVQGAGAALLARRIGLRRVFVLDDAEAYGLDVAGGFTNAARHIRLPLAGWATWDVSQSHFDALAARVQRARADGVFLGGFDCPRCAALIKALRARLPTATLIAPDGFLPVQRLVSAVGSAAEGMYLTEPGLSPSRFGARGQKLQRRFGRTQPEEGGAPLAAQAMEILLHAIARSDGTRASVTAHVLADRVRGGFLADFSFDGNGDMTPSPVTVYRIKQGGQLLPAGVLTPSRLAR